MVLTNLLKSIRMAFRVISIFLIISLVFVSVNATVPVPTDDLLPLFDSNKAIDKLFRLEQGLSVVDYDISITVPIGFETNVATFDGEVIIKFTPKSAVKIIYINAADMVVENTSIKQEGTDDEIFEKRADRDRKYEIIGFELKEDSEPGKTYILKAKYKGNFQTELYGFYKSKYKNAEKKDEYLLATQFQPTNARRLMPCFDEPEYKAKFALTIKYPKGYKALFNTEGTSQADEGDYHVTKFPQTPRMSTYLLAITISKFQKMETELNGITHRVWSQPNYDLESSVYALKNSPLTIQAMKVFTGKDYTDVGIKKIDHIGLPDFQAGAMENWGLITYRDSLLLRNAEETSTANHKHVCTIVAHELAHFWFGNLKTTKWWDTVWLNEGFATYFEYMAAAKVEPEWELDYQFVIEKHFSVMNPDASSRSRKMNQDVDSPKAILGKFDEFTYGKGGSLLRMIRLWTDEANFNTRLAAYFNQPTESVIPADLWRAMDGLVEKPPAAFSDIMNSYVENPGLPLLIVTQTGKDISITQKRFLFTPNADDKTKYYVPITYTGQENSEISFKNTKPQCWLKDNNEDPCTLKLTNENDLFFINIQASAYARVKYEPQHWLRIRKALNKDEFNKIHILNRVQLIEDAFALARGAEMEYEWALNIVSYLEHEVSYYPWYSGFKGFEYLLKRFNSESNEAKQLKNFILDLMTTVYTQNYPEEKPHITKLKKSLLKSWRCKLGDNNCINDMVALFENIKTNKWIDPDLRSTVYCVTLRESATRDNWDMLLARYKETKLPSEVLLILPALGCTKIEAVLKEYLDESLNPNSDVVRIQDRRRVFSVVLDGNPGNVLIAAQYFKAKYQQIKNMYPDVTERAGMASEILSKSTTNDEIQNFQNLLTEINDTELSDMLKPEIAAAKKNVEWADKNKQAIGTFAEKFLKRNEKEKKPPKQDGGAGSIVASSFLIITNVVILYLKR